MYQDSPIICTNSAPKYFGFEKLLDDAVHWQTNHSKGEYVYRAKKPTPSMKIALSLPKIPKVGRAINGLALLYLQPFGIKCIRIVVGSKTNNLFFTLQLYFHHPFPSTTAANCLTRKRLVFELDPHKF